MQSYFIKQRDELCKNGELLQSPALSYTLMHLTAAVESLRQNKILQESLEDENETRSSDDSIIKEQHVQNSGDTMTCNQQTYKVGEFVYLDSKEKGCEPHILLIERLWTNNGQQMLYGNYYLRPIETYHVTTRKFLEKEVFKSDTHIAVPLEEVRERCCVMNIKQYFSMRPEGTGLNQKIIVSNCNEPFYFQVTTKKTSTSANHVTAPKREHSKRSKCFPKPRHLFWYREKPL